MEDIATEIMTIIRYIFVTACSLSEENEEKENYV